MEEKVRLKVLIIAAACHPDKGSEPGMGFTWIRSISRHCDLDVICGEKENNREAIERELKTDKELAGHVNFHYIPRDNFSGFEKMLIKAFYPFYYNRYRKWMKKAYRLALQLESKNNYDILHQLNMVGFREPGYLWKLNKPFVWGPVGGTEITPWRFIPVMGFYGAILFTGRNLINLFQLNFSQRPKKAANRERAALIAATPGTRQNIRKYFHARSTVISEVGLVESGHRILISIREPNEPLKIIWAGKHIPGKALNILLRALAYLPLLPAELHAFGDGVYSRKWKKLSRKLKIGHQVHWHGWKTKNETVKAMQSGHVFCISSLHDLTSTVTLEALSMGLPVICPDHCGFAHVIDGSCGIKIPVDNPANMIRNFRIALDKLYNDELMRRQLAGGALERAAEFSWQSKAVQLLEIYHSLIDS